VSVSGTVTPQPRLQLIIADTTLSKADATTLTVTVYNAVETALIGELYIEIVGPGGYRYYDSNSVNIAAKTEISHHFEWRVPDSALNGEYRISTWLVPPILGAYDAASLRLE